jgi:hypothetical protein
MIKSIISFILFAFVIVSCQEHEKPKETEIITERNNASDIDTLEIANGTLKNEQTKLDTILPTPDSLFYENVYRGLNADGEIIDKYIKTFFKLTKPSEGIKEATPNHPEYPDGGFCEFRTEYGSVTILEEHGCDSYDYTKTYEFNNYSLKEVTRIIKTLLPKVATEKYAEGWRTEENYSTKVNNPRENYTEEMCTLEIIEKEKKILVQYGCGC